MSVEQMFREKTKQELRNRNSLPTFPTDATIWHQTGLCFVLLNNTVIRPLLFQVGVILTDWDAFLCVCHWFHTILQRFQFFTSSMWSLSWMYVSSYQGAFFRVYVINRWVASMLVAVNSCDVFAYNKWLFDVTLVIWPPQAQTSSVIVSRDLLYTMIGDSGACGGQITKVTSNNRLL